MNLGSPCLRSWGAFSRATTPPAEPRRVSHRNDEEVIKELPSEKAIDLLRRLDRLLLAASSVGRVSSVKFPDTIPAASTPSPPTTFHEIVKNRSRTAAEVAWTRSGGAVHG